MAERSKRYQEGLAMRREVLGGEYVDRARAEADAFTAELQDFLNENVWGQVWTRPGLDRKIRSLITLTVLGCGGRTTELKAHTVGALRNGCTPDQIKELFLQLAVYAGAPVAVEAFRAAQPAIAAHVSLPHARTEKTRVQRRNRRR